MNKKKEIIKKLEERKDKLKAKGVKKIGLFGSYLKGTQKRGSDIDFLVSFEKIDSVIDKSLRKELNYIKKEIEYVEI